MNDAPDLPDDCWVLPTAGLGVGDVCGAVPLPKLEEGAELATDPEPPRRYWVEAQISFALVLGVYDVYAALAPISVADTAPDADDFATLVETGRSAKELVRLPELYGHWSGDAVTLLFCPHTRLVAEVEPLREASMTSDARDRLRQRIARAFEV